jgi:peptidoglycan/xylan/chitin deacetylase (PgdA/CDA1 family)
MTEPVAGAFAWPGDRRAAAAFTFDVDAESAVIALAPEAARHLGVMSHQAYGPRTGLPRLLKVLERRNVQATFFVPGAVAERWPDAIRRIRDDGHELGHHGYLHEPVADLDQEAEERVLLRGLEALDRVCGVRPVGYRAPMWELGYRTPAILARNGFLYDSSLMDDDRPYRLAAGPTDHPEAESIVEIPVQWGLDDWEPYVYLPGISGSGVIAPPAEVVARWEAELLSMVAVGGCFVLTNHPFASGRPSRAAALEGLIERAQDMDGLWIATLIEIAEHVERLGLPPFVHRPLSPGDPSGVLP